MGGSLAAYLQRRFFGKGWRKMDYRENFDDSLVDGEPMSFLTKHKLDDAAAWFGAVIAIALVGMMTVAIPYALATEPAAGSVQATRATTATMVEKIDPAEVRRKIAALALPDETAPYDQQAINWLSMRAHRIVPQLVAGLDDKNPKVAEQCLDILRNVPANKELLDARIAKAGDEKSPLRYRALRQLEKSAADPRVARLLDGASTEVKSFPDPVVRARWAWLAGQKDRAVQIIKPLILKIDTLSFEHIEAIRLLGEIGNPASIELLNPIAAGDRWGLATEAYNALAKIDPKNHGLTKDQATLLKDWHGFKETTEHFQRRMADLAKLNAKEVRPFVMQMLRDEDHAGQHAALLVLTAWKDKEALPQIRGLMEDKRSYCQQGAVVAYLSIGNRQQAEEDVLALLEENESFANEAVLSGIGMAAISADRKVAMLRAARAKVKALYAVPHALRYLMRQEHSICELLVPLADEETNLQTLAGYCEVAAADKEKRFAAIVRQAMKLLSSEPTVADGGKKTDAGTATAGQRILEAVAAYDLKELAPDVQELMSSENATIRNAAQATGAKLGVPAAMKDLYAQLSAGDANVSKLAANSLMGIKLTDEKERAAREEAILSCLGRSYEDYAMRLLVTCGGEKSVKALESILDNPDARRVVYAAWVLAQLPDKAAAAKGVRRVAIFGMFCHQFYQQGAGIDFYLAPDLYFHQTTERLNPNPKAYSVGEGPVRIPNNLLQPFVWDDGEQHYAVRCYQLAEVAGDVYSLDVDFLGGRTVMDRTHLPLLKEIAAHDSHLERLMVKGQAVAHFKYRQLAAKAIAAITKEKATYLGLAGEMLDSDAFPEPYQDQDQLLAKFVVGRVQKTQLPDKPQTDRQWQQFEIYRVTALHLREKFGEQVLDAIRQEAKQQKVSMQNILPTMNP